MHRANYRVSFFLSNSNTSTSRAIAIVSRVLMVTFLTRLSIMLMNVGWKLQSSPSFSWDSSLDFLRVFTLIARISSNSLLGFLLFSFLFTLNTTLTHPFGIENLNWSGSWQTETTRLYFDLYVYLFLFIIIKISAQKHI